MRAGLKAMRNQVKALKRRIPANPEMGLTAMEWEILSATIFKAIEPCMSCRVALADALVKLEHPEEKETLL